jgi:uncharacterized membrane protein YccC
MTAALRFKRLLLSAAMLAMRAGGQPAVAADDINQHTDELRTIERQIENANARTASLDREREALEAELAGISQRLVDLAGNIQNREARIRQTEVRLEQLATEEKRLRKNLSRRRAALADLLAGLQRLERNPPPPLAVEPEDARKAVRGSLLLVRSYLLSTVRPPDLPVSSPSSMPCASASSPPGTSWTPMSQTLPLPAPNSSSCWHASRNCWPKTPLNSRKSASELLNWPARPRT